MTEQASTRLRRWLPLALLATAFCAAYLLGLTKYLSLGFLALKLDTLQAFVAGHQYAAIGLFILIYIVVVALSLPGATSLTLAGAVIFGWKIGTPATVIGATAGAVIAFQSVKTSLGQSLVQRAGPTVERLADGFSRNAFNYLLMLRLAPIFPFFLVNIAAGVLRVDLRTFVAATVIGIIPGSLAFNWLGSSVSQVLSSQAADYRWCVASAPAESCHFDFSVSSLFSTELLAGLFFLAAVSLLPIVIKWIKGTAHV